MTTFKPLQHQLIEQRYIMQVDAVNEDDTVTVSTQSGHSIRAIGSASIGERVYVQGGRVLGSAPDLPHIEIEV